MQRIIEKPEQILIYGGKQVIHIPGSGEALAVAPPPRHLGLCAAFAVFLIFLAIHLGNYLAHIGIFCAWKRGTLMKFWGGLFLFCCFSCAPRSESVGKVKGARRGSGLLTV
jgi:hypothetical protein